jgi:hypothetical protein
MKKGLYITLVLHHFDPKDETYQFGPKPCKLLTFVGILTVIDYIDYNNVSFGPNYYETKVRYCTKQRLCEC